MLLKDMDLYFDSYGEACVQAGDGLSEVKVTGWCIFRNVFSVVCVVQLCSHRNSMCFHGVFLETFSLSFASSSCVLTGTACAFMVYF